VGNSLKSTAKSLFNIQESSKGAMKMVSTIDDTKRLAIATKLADMKALQNLLISNEEKFIQDCTEDEIHKRLQDML
jgi:hypothetical protein